MKFNDFFLQEVSKGAVLKVWQEPGRNGAREARQTGRLNKQGAGKSNPAGRKN
jgi:hypothetical protein